jgi:hypothetical protein
MGIVLGAKLFPYAANTIKRQVTRSSSAPARESPTPATEQKQHYQNNQYGFHLVTSLLRGNWTGLL